MCVVFLSLFSSLKYETSIICISLNCFRTRTISTHQIANFRKLTIFIWNLSISLRSSRLFSVLYFNFFAVLSLSRVRTGACRGADFAIFPNKQESMNHTSSLLGACVGAYVRVCTEYDVKVKQKYSNICNHHPWSSDLIIWGKIQKCLIFSYFIFQVQCFIVYRPFWNKSHYITSGRASISVQHFEDVQLQTNIY